MAALSVPAPTLSSCSSPSLAPQSAGLCFRIFWPSHPLGAGRAPRATRPVSLRFSFGRMAAFPAPLERVLSPSSPACWVPRAPPCAGSEMYIALSSLLAVWIPQRLRPFCCHRMGVWSTAPLPLAAAACRVPRPCCHSRGLVEGSKSWQLCARSVVWVNGHVQQCSNFGGSVCTEQARLGASERASTMERQKECERVREKDSGCGATAK